MSSVANTSVSLRPASTVVPGPPYPARSDVDDDNKRDRCLWFEKHLRLKEYLRDKKNEERGGIEDGCIRVNSKLLLTSYQIPVARVYGLIKQLHRLIAPGLNVWSKKRRSPKSESNRQEIIDHVVLCDWIACSDFTVQVLPKFPSVLWFDLECMVCKGSGHGKKTRERHFRSKEVIEVVITVVLDSIGVHASVVEKCDSMYVTRGNTCGMHMFLPQVIVQTEYDGQELWAAVNKRLWEKALRSATVDTGCSSMPLPLARNHSGLTRIGFERSESGGELKTRSYEVTAPTVKELSYFSNISHLVSDPSPPPSSVATDVCRSAHDRERTSSPFENESTNITAACVTEVLDPIHDSCTSEAANQDKEKTKKSGAPTEKDFINDDATSRISQSKTETIGLSNQENNDSSDRISSFSSSSSKCLVQSDIRSICSKIRDTRKRSISIVSEGDPKRRRTSDLVNQEPIIIVDDEKAAVMEVQGPDGGDVLEDTGQRKTSCAGANLSSSTSVEPRNVVDDTASSFLCDGYVPSVRCSERTVSGSIGIRRIENRSERGSNVVRSGSGVNAKTSLDTTVILDSPPSVVKSVAESRSSRESNDEHLRELYVADDSIPPDARLPNLRFSANRREDAVRSKSNQLRNISQIKETFARNMRLNLDSQENQTHETDVEFIISSFNTEMDFYISVLSESTPVDRINSEYGGLRTRGGCSLHTGRENCPNPMFTEHVPFVLCSRDFVTEMEWISVLVHYYDEYLNNAPFLHVMSHVIKRDENIKAKLNTESRVMIERSVDNCLNRFKMDMVAFQNKLERGAPTYLMNPPKHPYDEKCTVVIGLIAICSTVYNIITPVFTDLVKICRLLLGNTQQTLELLNSSTMSSAIGDNNDCPSYSMEEDEDIENFFDESVSRADGAESRTSDEGNGDCTERDNLKPKITSESQRNSAHLGNNHSILASVLRWNYPALGSQTLWGLFFYYYHVHSDALTRIVEEVVHGGLMVTAMLQAYFEDFSNNTPVDVRMVCGRAHMLYSVLENKSKKHDRKDRSLMPPPKGRGAKRKKPGSRGGDNSTETAEVWEEKRRQFEMRPEDSKRSQKKFQVSKNGRRYSDDEDGDDDPRDEESGEESMKSDGYLVKFDDVLTMVIQRYLRPVSFDEATVIYTEGGYEQNQNEVVSYFSDIKNLKRTVSEVFTRSILKYSMPHGDLLMYNTDVMGTVHRRSSCTNNLVLNIFENMYGGCMSYLTRRYGTYLKIHNRFNTDAYRLVVECRHAMGELVKSMELSYLNLILRQPIVPPVLESDITVRQMFMSEEEIQKGAFVCLTVMDYVRSVNMFTRHSKFSQENCKITESFLDKLIVDKDILYSSIDEDARMRFRTVYLFFQLYIFEVLYKIRHVYRRDGYRVSVERLSWEMDVRLLLKLFFGPREFKTPRGLPPEALDQLDLPVDLYSERTNGGCGNEDDDFLGRNGESKLTGTRCINTRPLVSTEVPNKMTRMKELFGRKGIVIMKSYAPIAVGELDPNTRDQHDKDGRRPATGSCSLEERAESTCSSQSDGVIGTYEEQDQAFFGMTQAQLEEALYSSDKWYDNCRVRTRATRKESKSAMKSEKHLNGVDMCMDATPMDTFLNTQLRINIENGRLHHVERYVREKHDFAFCTDLPLRVKMIALVLATHAVKRLTADVAMDYVRKEYHHGDLNTMRMTTRTRDSSGNDAGEFEGGVERRPDREWIEDWSRLLTKRKPLLIYCRSLAKTHFPESYFIGLQPENAYDALYNYMLDKSKYVTLQAVRHQAWAKDICVALNYLLVMNAYDPELVELSLRLFLGFEWPGQWAKRIFVWKSNSNAGKSFLFEHVIRKAFDQSTCINDPKGGKDNAPEKSEYYKNFVLMINEFSSASAGELKKLCSTSSYKFRMNFGNQMIQAFMVGKMVFNCNTLPLTTDHATIQRVALVPLPFWFQKRQTVVDSMLNWTRGQLSLNDYERNFRRNIANILLPSERNFFINNRTTKNEDDLFNKPNNVSMQPQNEFNDQNARASMFLVQNKTSQVYMMSDPPTGSIVSGIVSITRYFCRFRFFNNIKEPVDYSVLPTACLNAAQEWQRISQPYFEWKERYQVRRDTNVRTKVSTIYASINHFTKTRAKNVSFFDLRQFFEWDFAEHKIPYYNAREDEYYVKLDPIQD